MSAGRWIVEREGRRLMELRAGREPLRVGSGPRSDLRFVDDRSPGAPAGLTVTPDGRAVVQREGAEPIELGQGEVIELGGYALSFEPAPSVAQTSGTFALDVAEAPVGAVVLRLPGGPVRLEQGRTYALGREAENDLMVDGHAVSGVHCELSSTQGSWVVRDLGSTNGTSLNGVRITQAQLPRKGTLQLGDLEIPFEPPDTRDVGEGFHGLLGESSLMQAVFRQIEVMAKLPEPVLVLGETGTGKELVAAALHSLSGRRADRMVVKNCGAIPEALAESELFGSREGAFSGAVDNPGVFEAAAGGTVFLDEIGELPLSVQPKLLRAVQEKKVQRLGSQEEVAVDFRLIAATHRDLPAWIDEGRFREDLYHRLGVFTVQLPPLRERREDIHLLARHLLGGSGVRLSADALHQLESHSWPGNVRELRNVLIRASAFRKGDRIETQDLGILPPHSGGQKKGLTASSRKRNSLDDRQVRELTAQVWEESGRSVSRSAAALGIAKSTMHRRKEVYGLPEPLEPT